MKVMISGHRKSKLTNYSEEFIKTSIELLIQRGSSFNYRGYTDKFIGLSGMADGVDLWFCELCRHYNFDYWAYIPFENQEEYMSEEDKLLRTRLLDANQCRKLKRCRNREMVQDCDKAIVVWDGNKGGTHNVFQQLVENKKSFRLD